MTVTTTTFKYRGLCTNYNGKSYKIPRVLFCIEINSFNNYIIF